MRIPTQEPSTGFSSGPGVSSAVTTPACHQRCFTAKLINPLLLQLPRWLSVINTYSLIHLAPITCPSPFLVFWWLLFNHNTERVGKEVCVCERERRGVLLIVLLHFVSLAHSVVLPSFCGRAVRTSRRWQSALNEGFLVIALLAFGSIRIDCVLQFVLTVQRFASLLSVCSRGIMPAEQYIRGD